jgi:hypothetical protein
MLFMGGLATEFPRSPLKGKEKVVRVLLSITPSEHMQAYN